MRWRILGRASSRLDGMTADAHADIPSAPQLRVLRAALQRPLPPALLRRLVLEGAPQLQHVDLVCSGSGAGGFDDREVALLCRLPQLSRLRFRCGARPAAAAALTACDSLREVEISSWSCPAWPQGTLRAVAAVLHRRGGSLKVAGEAVSAGGGAEEDSGEGGAGRRYAAAVPLRLRYPRSVMMALRSTPGSQQSLRACGLQASVPPALAAVRW